MSSHNLTAKQEDLLRKLVAAVKEGAAKEPLIPAYTAGGDSIIGIDQKLGPNLAGDLEALEDQDLLGGRYNSQGKRIFTIKQRGYEAVESDFQTLKPLAPSQVNIGAIIHQMEGGNLQAVGFASEAEITQISNDAVQLEKKLDELSGRLFDAVKSELPSGEVVEYVNALEELKREIKADNPSVSALERLFKLLSFMGTLEGAISLSARAWPHIYPLMLIAVERLGAG